MNITYFVLCCICAALYVNFLSADTTCESNSTGGQEDCLVKNLKEIGDECENEKECRTKNAICGYPHGDDNGKCMCPDTYKINSDNTECVLMLPKCKSSEANLEKKQMDCKDEKQYCKYNVCYCRGPYVWGIAGSNGAEDVYGCIFPHSECFDYDGSKKRVYVPYPYKNCYTEAKIDQACIHDNQCTAATKHSFCDFENNQNNGEGVCHCAKGFITQHDDKYCLSIKENFEKEENEIFVNSKIYKTYEKLQTDYEHLQSDHMKLTIGFKELNRELSKYKKEYFDLQKNQYPFEIYGFLFGVFMIGFIIGIIGAFFAFNYIKKKFFSKKVSSNTPPITKNDPSNSKSEGENDPLNETRSKQKQ